MTSIPLYASEHIKGGSYLESDLVTTEFAAAAAAAGERACLTAFCDRRLFFNAPKVPLFFLTAGRCTVPLVDETGTPNSVGVRKFDGILCKPAPSVRSVGSEGSRSFPADAGVAIDGALLLDGDGSLLLCLTCCMASAEPLNIVLSNSFHYWLNTEKSSSCCEITVGKRLDLSCGSRSRLIEFAMMDSLQLPNSI